MTRLQANAMMLAAALLWGTGNVAQKTVLEDLGPVLSSGLRSLIGAAVVLPLLCGEVRSAKPLTKAGWRSIAAASVFFTLALGFQQMAYAGTSVTNASFFVNTTVVFTPLLAWMLLRERPRRVTWPAVALVLCGVVLLGAGLSGLGRGDVLCLISAVLYAVWIVLVAEVTRRVDRPFTLAASQFTLAAVVGIATGLQIEAVSVQALAGAAPELFVLGVLSTGVAFTLQAVAQRATSATDAAIILSAESIFGAIAAAALLGEQLTAAAWTGASLIWAAILLVQVPPARFRYSGLR